MNLTAIVGAFKKSLVWIHKAPARPIHELDDLRQEMQSVLIAFAATYTRHMEPEQIEAARAEFNALVIENGWETWFASSGPSPRPPGPLLTREIP